MDTLRQTNTLIDLQRPFLEADFDGYRAAPLLIVGNIAQDELVENQDRLAYQFKRVAEYELADHVNSEIVEFVCRSIEARMQQREGQNGVEYMKRLNHAKPDLFAIPGVSPVEVAQACVNAWYGRGNVAQNNMARCAFGMGAGELANLTIIDAFRKELESPMWKEVGELTGTDATPRFEQMNNFKLMGFDRDVTKVPFVGAMRIGMKRNISVLEDGTEVKGRTTAIITPRPNSEFRQSDAFAIREAAMSKADMKDVPEFQRVVRWLINERPPAGVVLARNETVYGVNVATMAEIMQIKGYHYNA